METALKQLSIIIKLVKQRHIIYMSINLQFKR